jgi:hypothetical protein
MLDYLKENLTSEDMEVLMGNEFNFPFTYGDSEYYKEFAEKMKGLGLEFKLVEQHGGEEQGSEYYYVFSVTHEGQTKLFRLDGWYQSFHGADFDDLMGFYEVFPKEKVVIVYER